MMQASTAPTATEISEALSAIGERYARGVASTFEAFREQLAASPQFEVRAREMALASAEAKGGEQEKAVRLAGLAFYYGYLASSQVAFARFLATQPPPSVSAPVMAPGNVRARVAIVGAAAVVLFAVLCYSVFTYADARDPYLNNQAPRVASGGAL
jgi:hypothetical protein